MPHDLNDLDQLVSGNTSCVAISADFPLSNPNAIHVSPTLVLNESLALAIYLVCRPLRKSCSTISNNHEHGVNLETPLPERKTHRNRTAARFQLPAPNLPSTANPNIAVLPQAVLVGAKTAITSTASEITLTAFAAGNLTNTVVT